MPKAKAKVTMEPGVKAGSKEVENVKKYMTSAGYGYVEGHDTPAQRHEITFGAAGNIDRNKATGMLDDPGLKVDGVEHTKASV